MGYATRVAGDGSFQLGGIDPTEDGGLDESEAEQRLAELSTELRELQELMFAAETNGILVILQGMDASGKDVTIGNVFAAADPASCRVVAFKEPTPEEEAHHFLWRFDRVTPGHGELVIFDRSYYEQVLLPQVHDELPEDDIRRRFANINDFERLLHEHGIIVMKVFLHVSEEEQERRLEEREANLETAWKISPRDWQERRFWEAYMRAFETTIDACASPHAPWYVCRPITSGSTVWQWRKRWSSICSRIAKAGSKPATGGAKSNGLTPSMPARAPSLLRRPLALTREPLSQIALHEEEA